MAPTLALDLTRLALGPVRSTPRGIDRVELAYARHFLNTWPGDCFVVLPTLWGVRCFDRARALRGIARQELMWREGLDPNLDPVYRRTKAFLAGHGATAPVPSERLRLTLFEQTRGFFRLLSATGFSFGRPVARALPPGSIYLNVGQLAVFRPWMSWLRRRPDVAAVFMIHDLIPLELPQHHLPIGIRFHNAIVRNVAEFAHAVIVPSHASGAAVRREMSRLQRGNMPIHAEHLPVPSEFQDHAEPDRELSGRNYFIVCGTIDSYKNQKMLLEVWLRLVEEQGSAAPKLVIAGSPGVTGRETVEFLDRNTGLHGHVMLASGLSTRALRQLMIGARALLMPSMAEGFGLPIVEALAQGVAVLASDIPAHREAGQGGAVSYVPVGDLEQWQHQIKVAGRIAGSNMPIYNPKTWNTYFSGIERGLAAAIRRTQRDY